MTISFDVPANLIFETSIDFSNKVASYCEAGEKVISNFPDQRYV